MDTAAQNFLQWSALVASLCLRKHGNFLGFRDDQPEKNSIWEDAPYHNAWNKQLIIWVFTSNLTTVYFPWIHNIKASYRSTNNWWSIVRRKANDCQCLNALRPSKPDATNNKQVGTVMGAKGPTSMMRQIWWFSTATSCLSNAVVLASLLANNFQKPWEQNFNPLPLDRSRLKFMGTGYGSPGIRSTCSTLSVAHVSLLKLLGLI